MCSSDLIDIVAEIEFDGIAECVMIAGNMLNSDGVRVGLQPPAFPRQCANVIMVKRITPLLRLQHQGETRITADIQRRHGIHLESSAHGHAGALSAMPDIDKVAGQGARGDQDDINADAFAIRGKAGD